MTNQKDKISIIMAVYNSAPFLKSSIESILNQTHQNLELIICDDKSTDDSCEIIESYAKKDSRIVFLKNNENLGASSTRNKCIFASTGEYIAIQDSDDISSPMRLEILLKSLQTNNTFDFVSCSESLFDNDYCKPYKIVTHKHFPKKRHFLRGMCFCHAGTLFKKDCLLKIGGYPTFDWLKRDEDYLMFMKLYGFGFVGFNIDDCLYYYRVDSNSLKKRSFKVRLKEIRVRAKGFAYMKRFIVGLPFLLVPIIAFLLQPFRKK